VVGGKLKMTHVDDVVEPVPEPMPELVAEETEQAEP